MAGTTSSTSRLTVEISSKSRYGSLSQALLSLALQTFRDFDVLIFDDNDTPKDLRELAQFQVVFQLFDQYKMGWQVIYGRKMGQHYNHAMAQKLAKTEWVFRFDDDQILEPDVLEKLTHRIRDDVGAIGGLVLPTNPTQAPRNAANLITDLSRPNIQWFRHPYLSTIDVDHLHSTFMYRVGLAEYELGLSPAAHREETLFTYEIKRKGYRVVIDTSAVTWHFRGGEGGIRPYSPEYFEKDEKLFQAKLREWGVGCSPVKIVPLDSGKGDHVIVKTLLPELKEKYGKVIIASCYPDVFNGEEQISISEAKNRMGNIDGYNIYRNMIDWGWTDSLESAYRKLYQIEDSHSTICPSPS